MPHRAGLQPDAGHDVDREVDVVRQVRVEVDERLLAHPALAGGAL